MRVRQSAPSRPADTRLRGALLMPLCALAVHQLRYYLAFGVHAPGRLAHDGHAYLGTIEPLVLLATALAAGTLIGRIARDWQRVPSPPARHSRGVRVWALCAVALLVVYCGQELLESSFASGHPAGLAGIVGHGGWIAGPVAILVAGALAAALRIAEVLVERAGAGRVSHRSAAVAPLHPRPVRLDWRLEPLSGSAAGRAPPRPACP